MVVRFSTFLKQSSAISASLLSLGLAVLGFGSIQLTAWWEYLLAIIFMLLIYAVLYVGIALINYGYFKFFKRANIKSDYHVEISELNSCIDSIYEKEKKLFCSNLDIKEYDTLLREEIQYLIDVAEKKIAFINRFSDSPTLKKNDGFPPPNSDEMRKYKDICKKFRELLNQESIPQGQQT